MANRKKGAKATEALKKELEKKKLKEEEEEEMESEDSDDEMDEEDSDFDSDVDDEEEEDEEDEEGESFEEDESEDEKSAKGKKALATKSPGKAMTPVQKKQEKLLTPAQKKKAETPKGKAQTPVAKKGMKIREMEEQEDDDDDEDDESFEEDDEEEEESGEEKKPVKGKKPETPAQKKNQGKQEMSAQKKIQGKADTPSQKNKKIETPKGIKRKGQDEVKELNAKKAKGLEDEEEEDDDDDEDDSFEDLEDEEEEESEEEKKPVKGKKPATPAQKKIQGKADTPFQKKNEKTETPKGVKRKGQDVEDVDAKKAKGLEDEAVKMSEERVKERNSRTLFVGQLPADTTLDEVKALSPDITVCRIPMRNGKKSSVYAFVEFNSEKKAEENYEKLQKKTVGGKQIVIDYTGEKSANYKKSPEVNRAVDKKVLFVGSVTCDISLEDLAKVFPNSSQIDFVNPPGCSSGRNVYVKFNTEEEAAEAFSKTGKLKIKGNSLTVLFAHARIRSKNMKTFRKKDFGKRMGQRRQKFQFKKKEESDNDSDDE